MQYITDLQVVSGQNASAPDGFEKIPQDLNKGAGGEYIYLCYKKSADGEANVCAVVDLALVEGKKASAPDGYEMLPYDLNKGAGGKYIFLCYKKGTAEQTQKIGITDIQFVIGETTSPPDGYEMLPYDLNKGAGGKYIFLCYKCPLNARNWMSGIDDSQSLSSLFIPGTHDSLTFSFTPMSGFFDIYARAQQLDLNDQLNSGVRYVDIRIDADFDGRHGVTVLETDFSAVMESLHDFLNSNPSESIIMRLKGEKFDNDKKTKFYGKMDDLLSRYDGMLWKNNKQRIVPLLGDARKKIVILDEMPDRHISQTLGYGFDYGDKAVICKQDEYKEPDLDAKFNMIISLVHAAGKLMINHVSAVGQGIDIVIKIPEYYADNLNPRVQDYLLNHAECNLGILIFDFITPELARNVILHNWI